jgi:hypothetical protein
MRHPESSCLREGKRFRLVHEDRRRDGDELRVRAIAAKAQIAPAAEDLPADRLARSFHHNAGKVPARNSGKGGTMHLAEHVFGVAGIDRRCFDAHQNLTRLKPRAVDLRKMQRLRAASAFKP